MRHNQSEWIARGIAEAMNKPVDTQSSDLSTSKHSPEDTYCSLTTPSQPAQRLKRAFMPFCRLLTLKLAALDFASD